MKISDIIKAVEGKVIIEGDLEREVEGCYVSDLLSDVLANSHSGNLWITQHTHPNVAAVAAVKEISGVLIVGGKAVDPDTLKRAEAEKVNIFSSELSSFEAAGVVFNLLKSEGKS